MTSIFPPAPPVGTPMLPIRPSHKTREFLALRRSANKACLGSPGPSASQLDDIIAAATRVPDHRRLSPWKFIVFEGDARRQFGEAAAEVQKNEHPGLDAGAYASTVGLLMRAPTVVAVISSPTDDGRTPVWEQELSVGAACYNLLLAANAAGWAGCWLTEWISFSKRIDRLLGLAETERVAGFIYLGTAMMNPQERARADSKDLISRWSA
jgi:nitroreductase